MGLVFVKIGASSKIRDIFWMIRDAGNMVKNWDCPAKFGTVGKYDVLLINPGVSHSVECNVCDTISTEP